MLMIAQKMLQISWPVSSAWLQGKKDNWQHCCLTPEEKKIVAEEGATLGGALGGPMFRTVNLIADAIVDEFPSVAVDTLAYQWSQSPLMVAAGG